MSVLYLTTPGTTLRKSSRRLILSTPDGTSTSIRLKEVKRVVLLGVGEITTPALRALLSEGIEAVFLSRSGKLQGRIVGPYCKNVFLRQAQFDLHRDQSFRLKIACSIVSAKIKNSRRLLQLFLRYRDNDTALRDSIQNLQTANHKALHAETLAVLMGHEGEAASIYFQQFGQLLLACLPFQGRSRRPPRDPVNALLSLGYTLLTSEAIGALASHGLDPDVGFLHELDYGRPSLALDLIEEFRQPVIDRFVITLINRRSFQLEQFEEVEGGGWHLKDPARKRFFGYYDRLLSTTFKHAGASVCYRTLIHDQAKDMARAVLSRDTYTPFLLP